MVRENKKYFPIFETQQDLVYLDSAASALRPKAVIDKEKEYYEEYPVNIHRGVYRLAERAGEEYEFARKKLAEFIKAKIPEEIVWTRNATEAINLAAGTWGEKYVKNGDEIALTIMEHHANLVPWQQLAIRKGAKLKYLDINEEGKPEMNQKNWNKWISKKTKIAAITQASNVLGTINDVKAMIQLIKQINPRVKVLVDGAQAVPRMKVDVDDMGADFYAATGHKMYGPNGVGWLWARKELLEEMPPYQTGGGMIEEVKKYQTIFAGLPDKFEAGTVNIPGVLGLGAAVKFLNGLGMTNIRKHEIEINRYALKRLKEIRGLKVLGSGEPEERTGIYSFWVDGVHPHDLAQILSGENIAVRAGHHCAQPLHDRLGLVATTRASIGVYTSRADVDKLINGIDKAIKLLRG